MKDIVKAIIKEIDSHYQKSPFLVAIDGRCASGKTTLASLLQKERGYPIIHMDHFFLRPEQASPERLAIPGANIDYERFLEEVMEPIKKRRAFSYRPYDCHKRTLIEPVEVPVSDIYIIEGSYSLNPHLIDDYNLKIFLDIDDSKQIERIRKRNGEAGLKVFSEKWIPLEEKYFSFYKIADLCDLYFCNQE